MAYFDGAFLAFISSRRRHRTALLLLPPHSWCRFSAQRSSVSEVTARARGDRDRSGAVARFGIWKRTRTKGMAGLLLDLSDPDDQCAHLRLSRYRRRQIERDQDDTRMAWPPPNLWIADAFVSGSRVCQCRTCLASLGRSHHAGGLDTWLRRAALVVAMAGAPGSLESAGGQSVVPAGDRGMVAIGGRGSVRAGAFWFTPSMTLRPYSWARPRKTRRFVRKDMQKRRCATSPSQISCRSDQGVAILIREMREGGRHVMRSLRERSGPRLAGCWYFLRGLHRMWNCTCHEPEAVY